MSIILKSGSSSDLADVDANKNLNVVLPALPVNAGTALIASEVHDGLDGVAKLARPTDTGIDFRLRVGLDTPLFQDNFNHAVVNASTYQCIQTTMTQTMSGGYLTFNAGNSVASAAVARTQTYRTFAIYGTYPFYFETWARFTLNAQTNNVCEIGMGYASGTTTPTDGVYFKLDTTGALKGVVNYNGVETSTSETFPAIVANEVKHYLIVVQPDRCEFWIDGVLEGAINRSTSAPSLTQAQTMPLLFRLYNSAATSGAQRLEIASINISQGDMAPAKTMPELQSGMGLGAYNAPHGVTAGQTSSNTNSAAPASATLSNTAAGVSTLGGQFQFAAVAGAETDYALFGYQVPPATAALPGRSLYITNIDIHTYNTGAAVGATATVLQWTVGVGSTAVSLATADSVSGGTRAPRRVSLGVQSLTAAAPIGAAATPITCSFDSPLMVEAGSFLHIILKMPIGLATASQIIRGVVRVTGVFR